MDVAALATAFVAAQAAKVQLAVAGRMLRMNADMDRSALTLLNAAQQNMGRLANVAAGVGTAVDISA